MPFVARPADVAERADGDPREVALENALRKARATATSVSEVSEPLPVLGVDTVVALDGRIYGKPVDADAARETLRVLGGAVHTVVSGLALVGVDGGAPRCATAATAVHFRALDEATIDWYVGSGEWRERAGGYAIQGRGMALIEAIDGDYSNVVGLPVATLLRLWPELLRRTP